MSWISHRSKPGKVKAVNLAPLIRSFKPNSERQKYRVCLLQIHRLTRVSVHLLHDLGLGKTKECKWCQHPNWTFASHWHYFPTDTLGRCQFVSCTKGLYLPFSVLFSSLASPENLAKCPLLPHTRTLINKDKNIKFGLKNLLVTLWSSPEDSEWETTARTRKNLPQENKINTRYNKCICTI